MTKFLPPKLRELFVARPPLEYLAPPTLRKMPPYTGLAAFAVHFKDDQPADYPKTEPVEILKPSEIRSKKRKRAMEEHEEETAKRFKLWDPHNNPQATEEAYNTLFVSKLNYKTTAETLRREFESIAPVKSVHLVRDLEGKSRGYAFIEMEDDSATKLAYTKMRGRQIDGADIYLDVERGRTVSEWRPRRFGNSKNTPRVDKPKKEVLKQQQAAMQAEKRFEGRRDRPYGQRDDRRGPSHYGSSSSSSSSSYRRDDRDRDYDRDRHDRYDSGRFDSRRDDYHSRRR